MTNSVVSVESVGARLRAEREMRGLTQEEFGLLGAVTRNSQAAYEAGRRACDVEYLANLDRHEVDVGYILTGMRSEAQYARDVAEFVDLSPRLDSDEKAALLLLARSIAQRGTRAAKPATPPIALPPVEALEQAFLGVLAASQHMDEAALAHELAKRLPTMLDLLKDPLTIETDGEAAEVPPNADPARRRA